MSFSESFVKGARLLLPTPFTIAIVLTLVTMVLAFVFTTPDPEAGNPHIIQILDHWQNGLWQNGLMVFAFQMMLMLVLGHVLALSKPFNQLIAKVSNLCSDTPRAAAIVCFFTLSVSFFNWGLGLIFGAIFARKVGEMAAQNNMPLNYPIIGAAGYSGLMVWHGGLSGSAPIKIAEQGHFFAEQMGVVSLSETVFSSMNITASCLLLIVLPAVLFMVGRKATGNLLPGSILKTEIQPEQSRPHGAEKLDRSNVFALLFSAIILGLALRTAYLSITGEGNPLGFINPNYINFLMLGLGIVFHGSFHSYLQAIEEAIAGASGILIQFPLYFGIMGIMNSSGLVSIFSDFFVSVSSSTTYPLFTFLSAGIVNVFVPSGGGQWAVQGGIIIEAANQLDVSLPKSIMAMAYGDQLTNMLQPFWALPLLGITGLKAKEILPYTLIIMLVGIFIFSTVLLIF